jgi:hypothetical protein
MKYKHHTYTWTSQFNCTKHNWESTYASERIWPIVKPMLRYGDHESIFKYLERIADEYFEQFNPEHTEPNLSELNLK